jgi:hypothetical protein
VTAIEPNLQPDLGHQLSRRVAAGEITRDQALRTSRQRRLLAETYGPDWRKRVFGGVDVQQVRSALVNGGQLDLYHQVMLQRAEMLARAAGAIEDARAAF